ncbi:MAG TPA: NrtR-regulated NrtX [Alteromonas sp.]|nr:NrtR-regulated NrtX [Alteromonadaceae bacterium]HBY40857.1 NrtR-regulated NrtX [Alteromonas sp.]|tara:strand:+ start:830 stop:1834 length:1005 start_codon:yes stop_codon:yes gene_type:complete
MFGINFYKADPSTHVMLFKNGEVKLQGRGTSFYYYAPNASIVAVPLSSKELPFVFRMKTKDFQEITVQGQITFRIDSPEAAAQMINFSINAKGMYLSDEPEGLDERIMRSVQVVVRNAVESMDLQQALSSAKVLTTALQEQLPAQSYLQRLGVEITEVSLTAISPAPETAKALEAEVREALLRDADNAIYARRLSSIEKEKQVREEELETEKAIARKQQDLEKQALEAEREKLQQQFNMDQEKLLARTDNERKRAELVELENANTKAQADAKAYDLKAQLTAFNDIDLERLKVMSINAARPEQLIAQAIENLTKGENKVGSLNFSPELLQSLIR